MGIILEKGNANTAGWIIIIAGVVLLSLVLMFLFWSIQPSKQTGLDRFMQDRAELFEDSACVEWMNVGGGVSFCSRFMESIDKRAFASSLLQGEWECVGANGHHEEFGKILNCSEVEGRIRHREYHTNFSCDSCGYAYDYCSLYSNGILEATPEELERWGVEV